MDTNLLNRKLLVADRYCGYILFFLMLAYFITGFGQAKMIMNPFLAKSIHEEWLPVPTFSAFLFHSVVNLRFILIRSGVRDRLWWNAYLLIFGIILFLGFLYIYLR